MGPTYVRWREPLLLQPGPLGVEYDEETRRLDLVWDPDSTVRRVCLAPRDAAVTVGVIDVRDGLDRCGRCRQPIIRAIGFVSLDLKAHDIQCAHCVSRTDDAYWTACGEDPATYLRRSEAGRRGALRRLEREQRERDAAYRATLGPRAVVGSRR